MYFIRFTNQLILTCKVKYWTTTVDILLESKGSEYFVPGYQEPLFSGYSNYQVLHLLCITTHIMVYKLYNDEFKEKRGKK